MWLLLLLSVWSHLRPTLSNAPFLPLSPTCSLVMHWLRLDRIPPEKQAMRAKAKRALLRFTGAAIDTLREDDEEFLQGGRARALVYDWVWTVGRQLHHCSCITACLRISVPCKHPGLLS